MSATSSTRLGIALLLAAAALPAQATRTKLELEAGEHPVARLLELASRQLGCSILVNPVLLQRLPPVRLEQAVRAEGERALAVFADLLFRSNLALLPADASLRLFDLVARDGPRGREVQGHAVWRTPVAIAQDKDLHVMVATVVPLQRAAARDAAMALRAAAQQPPLRDLDLAYGATSSGTAIVLVGWQPMVAAAIATIQKFDRAAAPNTPTEQLQARLAALEAQVAELEQRCAAMAKPGAAKPGPDK